ncbi:10451_t:CDS:2, partial [Gigaspora margarita]
KNNIKRKSSLWITQKQEKKIEELEWTKKETKQLRVTFRIQTEERLLLYNSGHDVLSILFDFTPSGSIPSEHDDSTNTQ